MIPLSSNNARFLAHFGFPIPRRSEKSWKLRDRRIHAVEWGRYCQEERASLLLPLGLVIAAVVLLALIADLRGFVD